MSDFINGNLNPAEAAELLVVTELRVALMARRVEEKYLFAGVHGNRGKVPWNKKDEEQRKSMMELVEKQYFDFNDLDCLEGLDTVHYQLEEKANATQAEQESCENKAPKKANQTAYV